MKAVGLWQAHPADASEALVDHDIPAPEPGPGDLLVGVEAVGVNPADARVRMRKTDDGTFQVLGWDVAGTVVETGSDAAGFAPGDKVFYAGDLTRPGGNAEMHVIEAALAARRPQTIAASAAAALPLTALTVWESLFDRLALPEPGAADVLPGKTLLVVGGAGGVGSMAIQVAKLLPGLTVIATASREASREWCLSLGADAVIDHSADMPAEIATRGLPAPDLILLAADPDVHFPALAQLVAPQGRICCIVPFDAPPDMNLLMQKSASLAWEFMFTRSMFATPDRAHQGEILAKVAALIDAGRLTPRAPQDLGQITAQNLLTAHRRIESKRTMGKLVLAGFPSAS